MKWGLATAVASAAAVAAASGAELLACDCADQTQDAAVGRCDAFRVRHHQKLSDSSSSSSSSRADRAAAGEPAEVKKFAPRFDGLRFIETLVTAHR